MTLKVGQCEKIRKDIMDPSTALLNNGTALLNFLSTPEGQKVAALNIELIQRILAFSEKMHNKINPPEKP